MSLMKSIFPMLAILILIACSKDEDPKVKPVIDSFTPDQGLTGTTVTINGSHFAQSISDNIVTFNGKTAKINSASATQLVAVVPADATSGKVRVSVNGSVGVSVNDFIVYGTPVITDLVPRSAETGTVITLTGRNFGANPSDNLVKFGDAVATVTASTITSLTVTVPDDAVTGAISVSAYGFTGSTTVDFVVIPVISEISPMSGSIGTTVTIKGTGLKGANITFGAVPAKKILETPTEVKVLAPYQGPENSTTPIELYNNSNARLDYPTPFEYASSWVRKKDFPGSGKQHSANFAIGSKAYFGLGYSLDGLNQEVWEYEPSTDNWTRKNDFPGEGRLGAFSFAAGGRGYVGSGYIYNMTGNSSWATDVWGYEPVTDTWVQRADFPGGIRSIPGSFVINNKAYVGVGQADGVFYKDYWEYDPETNSWTRKADCGGPGSWGFTIGDKGYSGENGTGFWEYDLSANQWTRKADIRSFFDQIAAFSIGNKGYVGANGRYYQYIPQANVWHEVDGPTTYQGFAKAVVINGKAYVLRGNEMWEFTPPE